MRIEIIPVLVDNYAYLIVDPRTCLAVAIDPGDAGAVEEALRRARARLSLVLVTHGHADHTAGCARLRGAHGCAVAGPASADAVNRPVAGGERVGAAGLEFEVMPVPGHTPDHVAYYASLPGAVWTGDALFAGGCGRVPPGAEAAMWASLVHLRALPGATEIYCGHEYTVENLEFAAEIEPANGEVAARLAAERARRNAGLPTVPSRMAAEKSTNPFLRCDDAVLQAAAGMADRPPAEVFAAIRRRKDTW